MQLNFPANGDFGIPTASTTREGFRSKSKDQLNPNSEREEVSSQPVADSLTDIVRSHLWRAFPRPQHHRKNEGNASMGYSQYPR